MVLAADLCAFVGLIILLGMRINPFDQVVLIIAGGLAIDPLAHFANAFAEARGSRAERLEAHALGVVGVAELGDEALRRAQPVEVVHAAHHLAPCLG